MPESMKHGAPVISVSQEVSAVRIVFALWGSAAQRDSHLPYCRMRLLLRAAVPLVQEKNLQKAVVCTGAALRGINSVRGLLLLFLRDT